MLRSHRLERLISGAAVARVPTENRGFAMNTMKTFTSRSSLSLLLCLAGLLSFAAPKAQAQEQKDPPTRVARISYVDGSVSLQPGGQGDWGAAAKNRPMTIGDKLWVDKDSRAELQAGAAAMHLGSMTALSFLNLDQGITQMRLAEGSLNFRVRELRQGDLYEVDAPNLAFTVKEAGAFRIDVDENGDSARVTVIRGEGEVTAGGKTYPVHAEERAEFTGTDNIESHFERAPGPDGLDRWAAERDLKEDNAVSGKYVSRDMPGYSDLDDYGDWRDEPEYGHVWYPREVEPDWAPYSYGYWNWVGPWGWTWVDYSPWGFAPYHYGRWNYFAGGWGWCPGPYYGPPCYGPAFVGFFGGGFGFGVGWFPLGWGEPYYPWFGCSRNYISVVNVHNTYIRNVNVLNNTNIHNINYVNAHNVHAVTAVDRKVFVNGQAVNRGGVHLTPAALKNAQVSNSVGIKPVPRSSLGAVNVRSHVATPPASVQSRAVVARTAPAPAASHAPVHTVNTSRLTAGRVGNSPVNSPAPGRVGNSPANSPANRPANGAMNQHTFTPNNAPAHNAPAVNGPANRPANGAINQHSFTPNAPAHNAPAVNNRPTNSPNTSSVSPRQRDLSQNRPPSAMPNSARTPNAPVGNTASQRPGNSTRVWEAQGNATDSGRAPAGFGRSNQPANVPSQTARLNDSNRPPWARSGAQSSGSINGQSRPSSPSFSNNRPNYSNNGGSYQPPQRTQGNSPAYNNNRGYSQQPTYNPPARSYSPPSRTYSPPSRNYPAPSRSYSPPSHSSSGGGYSGGGYRGGGGSYSGGGGSRGGGGGYSGGGSHASGGGGGSHSSGGGSSHGGGGGGASHGGGGGGSHGHR
jgi:hypothetical protein